MASSKTNKNGPGLFQLPPIALTTPNVFSSMSWFSCNTNNIFACCRWRAGDEISEKCVRVKATTACGAAPPEAPCEYGEGDCNGPGDVGRHDGHAGCRGELVCGSNNCRKFGLYYHEKDDCCERPQSGGHGGQSQGQGQGQGHGQGPQQVSGWGQWSSFGACSVRSAYL